MVSKSFFWLRVRLYELVEEFSMFLGREATVLLVMCRVFPEN